MDYRSPYGGHGNAAEDADDEVLNMTVEKCPSDAFALSNYVLIAPGQVDNTKHYLLVNNEYVFTAR